MWEMYVGDVVALKVACLEGCSFRDAELCKLVDLSHWPDPGHGFVAASNSRSSLACHVMECADDLVDKFLIAVGSQVEGFLIAAGCVKL
jgi:hypothetical protein